MDIKGKNGKTGNKVRTGVLYYELLKGFYFGGLICFVMFPTLQATQNPFYLHVGSHILESLEKHSKAEYVSVYSCVYTQLMVWNISTVYIQLLAMECTLTSYASLATVLNSEC